MTHHIHFRSSIDPDVLDDRAAEVGCESRAEYLRYLIRQDLQRAEYDRFGE